MLLVFGLRDYAVQTHIDPESFARAITQTVSPGHHKNLPADEKQDNCPLCQQLYGGQYVAPEALPFFLSILTVSTIAAVLGVAPHYDAVSHNWRGRGPPRI